jgi:tetrahydromethanopterin S-methyltransferase subunit B
MTADEFAALIEVLLAQADNGGLPIEEQIEVLERIVKAMRESLGPP